MSRPKKNLTTNTRPRICCKVFKLQYGSDRVVIVIQGYFVIFMALPSIKAILIFL